MNCKIEVFTCQLKSHQQHHYHHHAWTITTVFIVCVEFAMNFMWQKRKEIDIQIRAKRSDEKTMIWMTEQTKKMWTTTKQTNGKHNEMPQMNDRATTTNIIRRSSKAARRCDCARKTAKITNTTKSRAMLSKYEDDEGRKKKQRNKIDRLKMNKVGKNWRRDEAK